MENIATNLSEANAGGLRQKAAAYVELTKPRIAFMLVLTAAAGFYLGSKAFDGILFLPLNVRDRTPCVWCCDA
jgi:heme O synthase-like polyprenyltransferase